MRIRVPVAVIGLLICSFALPGSPGASAFGGEPGSPRIAETWPAQIGRAGESLLNEDLLRDWYWRLLGPSMPAGRAWTVVGVESDPKTLYVTTASGGLWKSTNNGTTFEPVFDNEGSASTGAVAIAVLASVLPACRGARLHPVEALRYE